MGAFLLSIASPESLSWIGFVVLAAALVGEAAVCIIPKKWETLHRELVFAFAVLAAGGYAVERVGDDAIIHALESRAASAEKELAKSRPRILDKAQQESVRQSISRFSGLQFDIITYPDDKESRNLLVQIGEALLASGWQFKPPPARGFLFAELVEGVEVEYAPSRATDMKPAAEALAETLTKNAIRAIAKENGQLEGNPAVFLIRVGKKP
jgi:hypothetical protein